jgi:hypothetical protein
MYRVARELVLVFEPRDSLIARLGIRMGFGQEYERAAVFAHGGTAGGTRDSFVPNFVYRWSESEVEKTIRSFEPRTEPVIRYFYSFRSEALDRLRTDERLAVRGSAPVLGLAWRAVGAVFPKQTNSLAFAIQKPDLPPAPWRSGVNLPSMSNE